MSTLSIHFISASGRKLLGGEKKFRNGEGMISKRIHESWTKKITKQVRFLQRKYNRQGHQAYCRTDRDTVSGENQMPRKRNATKTICAENEMVQILRTNTNHLVAI